MKLPFFYPEHPEFKQHVEDVTGELLAFARTSRRRTEQEKLVEAEAQAKDIVLHVGIRTVRFPWLRQTFNILRGRRDVPVDDVFEAGLERYLRESIDRATPMPVVEWEVIDPEHKLFRRVVTRYRANLLHELGLEEASGG